MTEGCAEIVTLRGGGEESQATAVNAHELHVLVDLNGWTSGHAMGVLAYRPAPIIINFMGFAGSTGTRLVRGRVPSMFASSAYMRGISPQTRPTSGRPCLGVLGQNSAASEFSPDPRPQTLISTSGAPAHWCCFPDLAFFSSPNPPPSPRYQLRGLCRIRSCGCASRPPLALY